MARSNVSPQFAKFMDKFKSAVKNAETEANKEIEGEISDYVAQKLAPKAKEQIEIAYLSAVKAWYDAYKNRKRYKPSGTLYTALQFDDVADDGEKDSVLTWSYIDDNLDRPSIYNPAVTYNIYEMAMIYGSHGNKLPYYPRPFKSTPLLDVFTNEKKPEAVKALMPYASSYAQEYYDANIEEKFFKHFNM